MSDVRPTIASVSGGKDSAAMCLHLQEQGIEYQAVFMDTGWEAQQTYDYLVDVLEKKIGPIEWIKPKLPMVDLIRSKAMFPGRLCRFCTQQLKIFPFIEWTAEREIVNTVGIRSGESRARSMLGARESLYEAEHVEVWRPILDWDEGLVVKMHKRHGLTPNPLYLKGATRVGCWPCIFSRKEEIRLVSEIDPRRIDTIRGLEEEVQEAARLRYEAIGETFKSLGYKPPTFFSRKLNGKHDMTPIDEMVKWAKTSHGGRQYEMLHDDRRGCLRWGMCDA